MKKIFLLILNFFFLTSALAQEGYLDHTDWECGMYKIQGKVHQEDKKLFLELLPSLGKEKVVGNRKVQIFTDRVKEGLLIGQNIDNFMSINVVHYKKGMAQKLYIYQVNGPITFSDAADPKKAVSKVKSRKCQSK